MLIVDGNNMGCRSCFANAELKNNLGIPTGLHYGFFNSIIKLKKNFKDSRILVVWDGKSKRRMEVSQKAVNDKIIPELYKANRRKDPRPQPLIDFEQQSPFLKKALEQAGIPQIRMAEYEADDLVASYAQKLSTESEVIIVSSDNDFYQLLTDKISTFDGMTDKTVTKASWEKENGVTIDKYLEICALTGDSSDNIFGVPSWGEVTALETIKEFGTCKNLLEKKNAQYGCLKNSSPDIKDEIVFKSLLEIKNKKDIPKYKGAWLGMPFSGVALDIENKKIKTDLSKKDLMLLMFQDRIPISQSLKTIDIVVNIPKIPAIPFNRKRILEYFAYYDIRSISESDIDVLEKQ